MNDEILKVEAAAIMGKDGICYSLPRPARHYHVGKYMIEQGHPRPFPGGDAQGFILTDGTFVTRKVAKDHAVINNQILPGESKCRELFSEDLW